MDHIDDLQREVCRKYGVEHLPVDPYLKVGISHATQAGVYPINGFRLPAEGDTCGWYIWSGEEPSESPDFFQPLHVVHLEIRCPEILPYLGLPVGWRFLLADHYADAWYDESLLTA